MNWKLIRIIDSVLGILIIRLFSILFSVQLSRASRKIDLLPKRILLIKFWGIGNIFMMLPSVEALQHTYPGVEIDVLTLKNNREAVHTLDLFKQVTTIDTSSIGNFIHSWKHSLETLTANRYDLAIDFDQFSRFSALMVFLSGAARSIGFSTKGQHRHHLYTRTVEYDDHIHITRSFYALVTAAGVTTPFSSEVQLPSFETLQSKGMNLLDTYGFNRDEPLVVMHIGTSENSRERRWPPPNYAALADLLTSRHGMQIAMTGLPDEAFLIAETQQHLKHTEKIVDLGGKLIFTEFCALITVADLVISADTATIHIASAIRVPVVGLYGPNSPHLYGPWGTTCLALYAGFDCSPCITNFNGKINTCRHPNGRGACMAALTVDNVYAAIDKTYLCLDAPHPLVAKSRKAA
jgi:heptosyltransferase-3